MFLLFILFVLVVIFLLFLVLRSLLRYPTFSSLRFFRVFLLRDPLFSSLRLFARPPLFLCCDFFRVFLLFFSPLGSSYARFSLLFCASRQKSPPHRALVFLRSICWFADVYGCRTVTSTAKNIIYQSEIYTKFSQFATPTH